MSYMQPTKDDYSINIPITFDHKGKGRDDARFSFISSLCVLGVTILLAFVIFKGLSYSIWVKIALLLADLFAFQLVIRKFVLHEKRYREPIEKMLESDYEMSLDKVWAIYDIDRNYPYICHFKDGKVGVFIRFEKDVVVGKLGTVMFMHYDGISEAYNTAHKLGLNMVSCDYMDNIGNDARIENLYSKLNDVENELLGDTMYRLYSNLQEEVSQDYACYDVYLFTVKERHIDSFWDKVNSFCSTMLGGNYITYKVLDYKDKNLLVRSICNLNEFSIVSACDSVIKNTDLVNGLKPIKIEYVDGRVEVLNKTRAELQEEERIKALEEVEKYKSKGKKVAETKQAEVDKSIDGVKAKESVVEIKGEPSDDDFDFLANVDTPETEDDEDGTDFFEEVGNGISTKQD